MIQKVRENLCLSLSSYIKITIARWSSNSHRSCSMYCSHWPPSLQLKSVHVDFLWGNATSLGIKSKLLSFGFCFASFLPYSTICPRKLEYYIFILSFSTLFSLLTRIDMLFCWYHCWVVWGLLPLGRGHQSNQFYVAATSYYCILKADMLAILFSLIQ